MLNVFELELGSMWRKPCGYVEDNCQKLFYRIYKTQYSEEKMTLQTDDKHGAKSIHLSIFSLMDKSEWCDL